MNRRNFMIRGFSLIEYLIIVSILVATFLLFKDYMIRGLTGRWKSGVDQFSFGRQYDPNQTVECAFDQEFNQGWYDTLCVENKGCTPGNKQCLRLAIAQCLSVYCQ